MIKIKTTLKESLVHKGGIGLFTLEPVKKGEVVITPSTPGLDLELSKEDFETLPEEEKSVILNYGFLNKFNNTYHLNFDNARFINHSTEGNIKLNESDLSLYATRDIAVGEELVQDYSEFEALREDLQMV